MTLQLIDPISIEGRDFEPRIVGQTTLFPLNDELQRVMETTFERAVQQRKTGHIYDWTRSSDEMLRINAQRVLDAFTSTLAPYIGGLPLKEGCGTPGIFPPPLMRYEAQYKEVIYSISFMISDKSKYLITSPELEYRLHDSSRIKPALEGTDSNRVYERILDYVFRRKELEREIVKNVEVKPWGYGFALKPVLVDDIPCAARELCDAAKRIEDQSEVIHQTALLLSFAQEGGKRSRKLEERVGDNPRIVEPQRRMEQVIYRNARLLLDTVPMIETPTLNKYFV